LSEIASRYRKLPVEIEAVQLTSENAADAWEWVAPAVKAGQAADVSIDIDKGLTISTLEGDMRASFGDWIIKGVRGEFYPCKPDIFEATYEPAAAQAATSPAEAALRRLGARAYEVSADLGTAIRALRLIRDTYPPGHAAHDTADAALNQIGFDSEDEVDDAFAESKHDALDAQSLHDSPGSDL
jgi:hypothetical protein